MTIGDSKLSNINNGINLKYPVSVRLQGLLLFRWSGQDRMSRTHTHARTQARWTLPRVVLYLTYHHVRGKVLLLGQTQAGLTSHRKFVSPKRFKEKVNKPARKETEEHGYHIHIYQVSEELVLTRWYWFALWSLCLITNPNNIVPLLEPQINIGS